MRKTLLTFFLMLGFLTYAQPKLTFSYDLAGNQIVRQYVFSGSGKKSKQTQQPAQEDFQKFFPQDAISYYPNPVQEELHLKWELANDNKMASIDIFNMDGQLLKQYRMKPEDLGGIIQFQDYPIGVYFVNLNYTNGEQKSIKIVKK